MSDDATNKNNDDLDIFELDDDQEGLDAWLVIDDKRFPGFEVHVQYISAGQIETLQEKARGRGRRGRQGELDGDKFVALLMPKIAMNWRGLKPKYVKDMLALSTRAWDAIKDRDTIDFTHDLSKKLASRAYAPDYFDPVFEFAKDLSLIREAQEAARLGN